MRTYPRATLLEDQIFAQHEPYWCLGNTIQLAESFDIDTHLCDTIPF